MYMYILVQHTCTTTCTMQGLDTKLVLTERAHYWQIFISVSCSRPTCTCTCTCTI